MCTYIALVFVYGIVVVSDSDIVLCLNVCYKYTIVCDYSMCVFVCTHWGSGEGDRWRLPGDAEAAAVRWVEAS